MRPLELRKEAAREWLLNARSNLARAAQRKLRAALWEHHCFDCQQAVEKVIKGVFVLHDVEFPYTHDIAVLIGLFQGTSISWDPELNEAATLTPYGVTTRYPHELGVVTEAEFRKALVIARKVLAWAEEEFRRAGVEVKG